MKVFTIFILILFASVLCSHAKSYNITISGFTYTPNLLTVNVGDEVVISASTTHPLRQVSKESWLANQTTELAGGWGQKTSNFTFNATTADTIYFLCAVHGPSGMKGKIIVLPSTSVNDKIMNKESQILLYPNPTSDFITITLKPSEGSAINIYNTVGEKVMTPSLLGIATPPNEGNIRIDISDLPKGMYFIRIGDSVGKFIKM